MKKLLPLISLLGWAFAVIVIAFSWASVKDAKEDVAYWKRRAEEQSVYTDQVSHERLLLHLELVNKDWELRHAKWNATNAEAMWH